MNSEDLSLRDLEIIKLHADPDEDALAASTISFLNDLLSGAELSVLHALYIAISHEKAEDFDVSDPDRQKAWTALDTTLALPRYTTLKHTAVRFFVRNSTEIFYHPLQKDVVKAALPKLVPRQNVNLTPLPLPT